MSGGLVGGLGGRCEAKGLIRSATAEELASSMIRRSTPPPSPPPPPGRSKREAPRAPVVW